MMKTRCTRPTVRLQRPTDEASSQPAKHFLFPFVEFIGVIRMMTIVKKQASEKNSTKENSTLISIKIFEFSSLRSRDAGVSSSRFSVVCFFCSNRHGGGLSNVIIFVTILSFLSLFHLFSRSHLMSVDIGGLS
jgi:hypothetical protein